MPRNLYLQKNLQADLRNLYTLSRRLTACLHIQKYFSVERVHYILWYKLIYKEKPQSTKRDIEFMFSNFI